MASRVERLKRLEEHELGELIKAVDMPEWQRAFLRARWLPLVLWMEGGASSNLRWYYATRLTTIIGGVLLTAATSSAIAQPNSNLAVLGSPEINPAWFTFVLSILVTLAAALEGFFRFGERWRHYRRIAEALKSEGWQFYSRSGRYRAFSSWEAAFAEFAAQIEDISQQDVQGYLTKVTQPQDDERTTGSGAAGAAGTPRVVGAEPVHR